MEYVFKPENILVTIKLKESQCFDSEGNVITDSKGMRMYRFTKDEEEQLSTMPTIQWYSPDLKSASESINLQEVKTFKIEGYGV